MSAEEIRFGRLDSNAPKNAVDTQLFQHTLDKIVIADRHTSRGDQYIGSLQGVTESGSQSRRMVFHPKDPMILDSQSPKRRTEGIGIRVIDFRGAKCFPWGTQFSFRGTNTATRAESIRAGFYGDCPPMRFAQSVPNEACPD